MALAIGLVSGSIARAGLIVTTFSNAEGFATGSSAPVTLTSGGLSAVFSGGIQQRSFDGPAYNAGPDAYMIVNGTFTGSFGGMMTGNTDVGSVVFNVGVDELSFFAADRANGTPSLRVLGTDGITVLATASITGSSNRVADGATAFSFSSAALGAKIGSIEFDNAGPAGNPPYVIALDSFSASAVPEPSSLCLGTCMLGFAAFRRRRMKPIAFS